VLFVLVMRRIELKCTLIDSCSICQISELKSQLP